VVAHINLRKVYLTGLLLFVSFSGPLLGSTPHFDIELPPSKAEWQHFNKMNPSQLRALWQFQAERGRGSLAAWAWQWRLGWIRHCALAAKLGVCPQILDQGLIDEAMVVRAESAQVLGQLSRGRPDKALVKKLATAYSDPRNSRNGSPLFVCDRIIAALQTIGDPYAIETATKLANKHPLTAQYWSKIQRQKP